MSSVMTLINLIIIRSQACWSWSYQRTHHRESSCPIIVPPEPPHRHSHFTATCSLCVYLCYSYPNTLTNLSHWQLRLSHHSPSDWSQMIWKTGNRCTDLPFIFTLKHWAAFPESTNSHTANAGKTLLTTLALPKLALRNNL